MGDGGWSPLSFVNTDPVCQGSFIRYSSTLDGAPRNRLLFSNPGNTNTPARVNQTVRMSEDEGQTWTVSRQIDTIAGYSCLTALPDGTVGLFYEDTSNSYLSMVFARFSLDWLTQADVDSDGDGMSDYYEGINGLDSGLNDAALDSDADGLANRAEFLAGTMANNPNSTLRLETVSATGVSWGETV